MSQRFNYLLTELTSSRVLGDFAEMKFIYFFWTIIKRRIVHQFFIVLIQIMLLEYNTFDKFTQFMIKLRWSFYYRNFRYSIQQFYNGQNLFQGFRFITNLRLCSVGSVAFYSNLQNRPIKSHAIILYLGIGVATQAWIYFSCK